MLNMAEWKKKFQLGLSENILLIVALIACTPLYLRDAFRYSVPMGYAGLFTQMAKQIADANFHLPMMSPFYGPGGIPFAYPPFGMYFLAVFIKLTGKYFIFLRLLPPLIGLISFIPLYFITLELSKSRLAAMASVIIAATSQDIYISNAWAAGIVRAPAFLFSLISIYFILRQSNTQSRSNNLLAGVFLGLTFMSHLIHALFTFLWIWWWSVFNKNILYRIKDTLLISAIGALVTSIWLVPVLLRHGIGVFVNAFGSHGGSFLLTFWSYSIKSLFSLFLNNISPISSSWPLALLVLIGVIFLLLNKNLAFLSLFLFVILVFPESDRFVFLMGSIAAGIGLFTITEIITSRVSIERLKPVLVAVVIIPVLGFLWQQGFAATSSKLPQLNSAMLDLADHVQAMVPPDKNYLALIKQNEAEWMPFLFQREPVVCKWGSEWLGTFDEQTNYNAWFHVCQTEQDWACVENSVATINVNPQYIISYSRDKRLNSDIQFDGAWAKIYENDRYVMWKALK